MTDQKKIDEARKLFEEQEIAQGRSVEMTSCGEYLDGVVFFGWLNELDRIDAEYAQAQKAAEQCETMQRPKSECGCPDCGSSLIDCPKAEPAPAQDERGAFEAEWVAKGGVRPGNYSAELDRYVSERVQGRYEGWKLARITRPAQAEQQPEQSGLRAGQVVAMCEVGHDRLERAALDTKRLEWMLAERCIIESQNGTGSPTVYRVAWPSLGEAQSEWYPTEREAIDNARGGRHE